MNAATQPIGIVAFLACIALGPAAGAVERTDAVVPQSSTQLGKQQNPTFFVTQNTPASPEPMPSSSGASLEQRFQRLDANSDGFITWKEALPSRASDFDAMDKNRDKRVTPDEFTGVLQFAKFDSNKDGVVSKDEFVDTHRGMFMKFDADGDQRVSPSEFATAQRAAGK